MLFLITIFCVSLAKKVVRHSAFAILMKRLDPERFPTEEIRLEKINKVSDHMLKMFFYIVSTVSVYLIIKDTDFCHWTLGGKAERMEFFDNYPCPSFPPYLAEYYIAKVSYYTHETVFHFLYHRKRHDFTELMLHHILTTLCTLFSYNTNFLKPGAFVLLNADFSDIWIALMKTLYEFLPFWAQLTSYLFMFISFVYSRLYVIPFVFLV